MAKKSEGWKNKRPDDPKRHGQSARGIKNADVKPRTGNPGPLGGEGEIPMWNRARLVGQYPENSTKKYVQKVSNEFEDQNYHTENLYLQAALRKWFHRLLRRELMARFSEVAKDALKGKRASRENVAFTINELEQSVGLGYSLE